MKKDKFLKEERDRDSNRDRGARVLQTVVSQLRLSRQTMEFRDGIVLLDEWCTQIYR